MQIHHYYLHRHTNNVAFLYVDLNNKTKAWGPPGRRRLYIVRGWEFFDFLIIFQQGKHF
jgi:hypothetical protein